ncbi:MAG TPA: KpsF/GutQ family sugar-phosphate isomerase [Gemmatimonadales bacterium]|nr:KpsF/GutQ family sugar-phosphate isomerase [Gemmatimonadales bacterium]
MTTRHDALVAEGRRVLELEAAELRAAAGRLDAAFAGAVDLLATRSGRVIVSGVGKSGLIARKLAATLTSTGTPATYLHPVDSLHGDLGIVSGDDVAIVLSKSGDSDDLMGLLASLQRLAVPIIAITGGTESLLARAATVVLDAGVREEACPHDLAPTSSTTVALALGDALAVALLGTKGFRREDFAALHPGGSLGRKLLLRVRDVMLPPHGTVAPDAPMREVVVTLAHHRGIALVVEDRRLRGVFTAGDLTRLAQRETDYLGRAVCDHMTRTPKTCAADDVGAVVVGVMERNGIMALPVLEAGQVVGVVHLHDLLRAGAV